MHCYRVYTPLWLWFWPWLYKVLQRIAWCKKIPARRYTHTARRSEDKGDVWVSRILKGYSQDAGCANWEPRHRRLVRRPCGKPERLVTKLWNVSRGHVRDVGLHAQKRGWARDVTWIAGRRRWSRYGESPRRRNVGDGVCEGDGAGLPMRDLLAVAVPGEFCVIKNRLRAVSCYPQQINKPVKRACSPRKFCFSRCLLVHSGPKSTNLCLNCIWSSKLGMQNLWAVVLRVSSTTFNSNKCN